MRVDHGVQCLSLWCLWEHWVANNVLFFISYASMPFEMTVELCLNLISRRWLRPGLANLGRGISPRLGSTGTRALEASQ